MVVRREQDLEAEHVLVGAHLHLRVEGRRAVEQQGRPLDHLSPLPQPVGFGELVWRR